MFHAAERHARYIELWVITAQQTLSGILNIFFEYLENNPEKEQTMPALLHNQSLCQSFRVALQLEGLLMQPLINTQIYKQHGEGRGNRAVFSF